MEKECVIRNCEGTNLVLGITGVGLVCASHSLIFLKPQEDICSIRDCLESANSLFGGVGPLCDRHSELIRPLKAGV